MYEVVKKFKRLYIVKDGEMIYTPPDFIRHKIKSREELEEIASQLNQGTDYIDAIMKFETSYTWNKNNNSGK